MNLRSLDATKAADVGFADMETTKEVQEEKSALDKPPTISVIIPTVGRQAALRSIWSAAEQSLPALEVLVVMPADDERVEWLRTAALPEVVRLVDVEGTSLGGALRQAGTVEAKGDWLVYLDDDDFFRPNRLAELINVSEDTWLAATSGQLFEESSSVDKSRTGAEMIDVLTDANATVVPVVPYEPTSSVSVYLFHRRKLGAGRNLLHTSMLAVRKEVAVAVGWNPTLRRHQDWDFILRCEAHAGSEGIEQSQTPTVQISTGTGTSVSAGSSWEQSLEWYDQVEELFDFRASRDFLIGQVGRYAVQTRSARGILTAVRRSLRYRVASPSAWAMCLSGLVPRRLFERMQARS